MDATKVHLAFPSITRYLTAVARLRTPMPMPWSVAAASQRRHVKKERIEMHRWHLPVCPSLFPAASPRRDFVMEDLVIFTFPFPPSSYRSETRSRETAYSNLIELPLSLR